MSKKEKEEKDVTTENLVNEALDDKEELLTKKRKTSKKAKEKDVAEPEVTEEAPKKEDTNVFGEKEEKYKYFNDEKKEKRWYIVHTYSGHEHKVKANLEKRIEYMNMGDKIFRVEVPQKNCNES